MSKRILRSIMSSPRPVALESARTASDSIDSARALGSSRNFKDPVGLMQCCVETLHLERLIPTQQECCTHASMPAPFHFLMNDVLEICLPCKLAQQRT